MVPKIKRLLILVSSGCKRFRQAFELFAHGLRRHVDSEALVEALRRCLHRAVTLHDRKEERILSPVTDKVLGAAERDAS